jgi:hypothetical protein
MKRPKAQTNNSELLATVKQLCTILKSEGHVWDTHILLQDHWAIAHNQVIGIGEKIKEDFFACPNAILLKEALAKCGQNLSITQLEQKLSIKSDKFRALVPCVPSENITRIKPDASVASLDDRLKLSLEAASILHYDENNLLTASVLVHNGCVSTTDRKVILQHFHGIDLPPNLVLPKAIIDPVLKNPKKLVGFGYSNNSCTFHYEDESWLKSQFYIEQWPDIDRILDKKINAWPLPENFYTAVKALEPFSDDGFVYFDSGMMRSHPDEGLGASYEIYGLPKGPAFSIKQLKMIEPYIKTVDFLVPHGNHHMMMFYGEGCRGGIAGRV